MVYKTTAGWPESSNVGYGRLRSSCTCGRLNEWIPLEYHMALHHPTVTSYGRILRSHPTVTSWILRWSFKNPMVIYYWWFTRKLVWMKRFPLCLNGFMLHGTAHGTASLSLPPLSLIVLSTANTNSKFHWLEQERTKMKAIHPWARIMTEASISFAS
jgi:hypothetical protein